MSEDDVEKEAARLKAIFAVRGLVRGMTPGQAAYEEDCRRKPYYPTNADGTLTLRRRWSQLGPAERASWERNPTPRDWTDHRRDDGR